MLGFGIFKKIQISFALNRIDLDYKSFILFSLFLGFCNPAEFENPCDPKSETFRKNYLIISDLGIKSGYCGISSTPFSNGSNSNTGTNQTPTIPTKVAKFLMVSNAGSNNVNVYTINSTTGALTQISGSPFAAGGGA
ncbi:MAG TPA: hypothetical protein PKX55_25230, partial [Leptospiraceae bacterium]|nr:hypothetical protein [Leptospiraceae bacterium]